MFNRDFFLSESGYSNHEDAKDLPRHRWYSYKEGFSPNLVKTAIEKSGVGPMDLIVDPFNGSGTTTLTASILGLPSIGVEVNPFTSFLASTKQEDPSIKKLGFEMKRMLLACYRGSNSDLVTYSTFSHRPGLTKWLFNHNILRAYEGGWRYTSGIQDISVRKILRLILIFAAMENCNAIRDGKCLRYRKTWRTYKFNEESFAQSILDKYVEVSNDLCAQEIACKSKIVNADVRRAISKAGLFDNFRLCVTSPPYLNTFDYTDIYRPELFLGKFVLDNQQLYDLRLKTVRSHVQAKWRLPILNSFGSLYEKTITHLTKNPDLLMDKGIPLMVQAYFEDMHKILCLLKRKAHREAQVWIIVSNSAYADHEIPVDLILADIGTKVGWFLKEIGVLRYIKKRKSNHSQKITQLRESVVILSTSK